MKIETLQSLIARTRNEINILHEEEYDLKRVIQMHTDEIRWFLEQGWNAASSAEYLKVLRKDLAKVKSKIKKLVAVQKELKMELNEAILNRRLYTYTRKSYKWL